MNAVGTKFEVKEIKGERDFVKVTYEASAWEAGPLGKHVTCPIHMFIRTHGQDVETTVEFGKRNRPTIIQSLDDIADQFELIAKAIRERKCSLNQIPLFLQ